ncbi:nucleotidyltransferase domain-containing protein [Mesoflavibacter sp. CH_XMU1422-2]|uniref:PD-(D/E)XK nuclease domain-containing protein n=1 Tax=Mesoflavibacter sp. CH_XMU1422-2 TaxID=3107770 RepID=UPI003008F23D|tara:strand:- start:53 stop:1033 length:981 start_codon:yes stop_codon:yes gene_type:complete
MTEEDIFDLEAIIKILTGKFPDIESVYLFGSRRFETGSSRSDIDILITTSNRIKPSHLRDFTLEHSTALDLFILENGRATSVANESYIEASDNDELVKSVNAVMLYDRTTGTSAELEKRKQVEVDKRINHELTSLPNGTAEYFEISALKKYFKRANENGLTAKPYIGSSTEEASEFIIEILKGLIPSVHSVTNHGQAKTGWTKNLNDEYDFQNLFWIVVKPWLPNLSREDVELKFDGQEKRSDFNLFNSQLVIELKHIKNDGDKRAIVKTLSGLKDFYVQHPNVRTLIFAILVEETVDLDDRKWESDFSFLENTPQVKTIVIRNKK